MARKILDKYYQELDRELLKINTLSNRVKAPNLDYRTHLFILAFPFCSDQQQDLAYRLGYLKGKGIDVNIKDVNEIIDNL